ncbi:carbohydrate ABC transporter permease [Sharpea azabuensis]|uniref:carbohydrate ABC transporter permease n=1 Tax=Sharpea azabuensis TaxID=322505 RepID=UPI0015695D94|nr:carbohydrate ABC transporter permease [Sharpea azabuensis]
MKTRKQKILNWILIIVMAAFSLLFLFPLIWMIFNSFKGDAAIAHDLHSFAAFLPPALSKGFFHNYTQILFHTDFLRYLVNTVFYAIIMVVLGIIVNGLAGYALAKINFPFRDRWLLIIMLLMIVPSPIKYFFTMVLPMAKSAVATVGVLTFLGVWNDYLWPSLVFTSNRLLTVQIGLNAITANENTTMGMKLAVITLVTIPVIIMYALFSKQIVEGVVSTGGKEG